MKEKNNYYEFEVFGYITAKARPRFNPRTGKAYTSAKTRNYEYTLKYEFVSKYPDFKPFEERVRVTIIAQFQIPKSTSKIKTKEMLEEKISPTKKPDIDNITKIVLDALNKLAYKDDTQVTELMVQKNYGKEEKTYIKIEQY